MNKLIILSISMMVLFASCSKDKTNTSTPETTTQKLQHKWNLVSIEDIQYLGTSTTQIDNINSYGVAGDSIDFSANNKAYLRIAGGNDTLLYSVLNDTKLIMDSDTFTINNLTASALKLTYYGRETSPVNNWDNVITLSR